MSNAVITAHPRHKRRWSETLKSFWLDIVLFFAFIVDMNTRFTGIAIHEWLGIGIGIALFYHLMLHWKWIVAITKRIFSKLPTAHRIRYLVDILLFVDMVVLIVTGLWISEVAMQQIGLLPQRSRFFSVLHRLTADWSIWLVGLHLALSWDWIVINFKKYILRPITSMTRRQAKQARGQA